LQHISARPLATGEEERARRQVLNYYQQNQQVLSAIHAAEFPVQIDRDAYVLRGKIDLLVNGKQGWEVIDFKTQSRPAEGAAYLASYRQQIQLYASALLHHLGQSPRRLWLYWTAEERRANALMEVSCDQDEIEQVVADVDDLAEEIQQKHFDVKVRPASTICQKCDIRHLCWKDGTLR
jgi:DNA helicase-2/ATP-dependent DNA helicase PcrA